MGNYKGKVNPFTGKLQKVLNVNLLKIKGCVDTINDLPLLGNTENDCYIVKDVDRLYTWTIPESSGTIDKWVDVGETTQIDWSGVLNKPTSTVSDIDDAVSKKHAQNTDTELLITSIPSSNLLASGIKTTFIANENQAFGDVCYINESGEAQIGDASAIANSKIIAMCIDSSVLADASGNYLLSGIARNDSWNFTVGGFVYLSTLGTSGNSLTQTAPNGEDECVVVIGIATHANRIYFNPQLVIVETVGV